MVSQTVMLMCAAVLFLFLLCSLRSPWSSSDSPLVARTPIVAPILQHQHTSLCKYSRQMHDRPKRLQACAPNCTIYPPPVTVLPLERSSPASAMAGATFLVPLMTQHAGPAQAADNTVGSILESIPQITPLGAIL